MVLKREQIVKSIGWLEYRVDDKHYVGKRAGCGNIIKRGEQVMISTAAHCVYEVGINKFNKDIFFHGITDSLENPLKVSRVIIHKKWALDHSVQYDTAFLEIEDSLDNSELKKNAVDVLFNVQSDAKLHICAAKKNIIGVRTIIHTAFGIQEQQMLPNMIGVKCSGGLGMSGGPWLINSGEELVQCSLTSMKMHSRKGFLWGPYWGKEMENMLNSAITKDNDENLIIHNL